MKFIAAVLLCACGSVQGTQKDADVDSPSQETDAYVPTCAAASFTTSAPVAGINTAADDVFLRLSDDELTAYFATLGTTASSLYATRGSKTVPFDSPNPLPIMGTGEVTSPTVTADGLTLYLISSRSGGLGVGDIWRSTRQSVTATFGTPANVGALNSAADELDVYVLPDNSAVYFSSARTNNVYSIWRAARNGAGFDAPVEVLSVAPGFANRVVVTPDELQLFYQAGNDIHISRRASKSDPFPTGMKIDPLNTVNADNPTWISADGCRLYFQTNRAGTMGLDFYVSVREPQ